VLAINAIRPGHVLASVDHKQQISQPNLWADDCHVSDGLPQDPIERSLRWTQEIISKSIGEFLTCGCDCLTRAHEHLQDRRQAPAGLCFAL